MKIKKIMTDQAVPGMVVADDVFAKNDQLIIGKNTYLTDRIITRLKFYSIFEISVFESEPNQEESTPDEPKERLSYSERVRKSPEFKQFNSIFVDSVKKFKQDLNDMVTVGAEVDIDHLLNEADLVIKQSRNGLHIFDMLHNMRKYDDLTYVHALNVSLICNAFGKWLKFSDEDLHVLTLAGLLHDIGKLLIPQDIITKPSKLTDKEYEMVKTHSMRGYYILKDKKIDDRIKKATLMHHEKCDGTGYPQGLVSEQIDDFAKIVAIADIYDAMTSARSYRGPLCPFEVMEVFETEGFLKYDPKFMLPFLEGITLTYMNNHVRLSNGVEGEIVMMNHTSLTKPIIQVGNGFIDLSKQTDLSITEIL